MIGFVLEFCSLVHLSVNEIPVKWNMLSWPLQVLFNESTVAAKLSWQMPVTFSSLVQNFGKICWQASS